jgi:glycosyltransferase involved in cell wall biosynthesis
MKIVVDTRRLHDSSPGEYGYFFGEILKRITRNNPEHAFIFIFDKSYDGKLVLEKNVTAVVNGPSTSRPLLLKLWYDIKLPRLLKKYNADVLVTGDGLCSLAISVPQCVFLYDLSYLFYPSYYGRTELYFLKRYAKKFLQKANSIITVSEFLEKNIISRFGIDKGKITVVRGSGENFYALGDDEKAAVRNEYTGGKNFFLYAGAIDQRKNLVNLLKAFSVFKKRQKSDWKLVLAGAIAPNYKQFAEGLKTYKYREDVVLTGPVSNDAANRLNGAAYAFIFPPLWEGAGVQVMEAMNCNVPVICSGSASLPEIAGDAALYVNTSDHRDIAEKMMLLYKDETMRNNMIEKGRARMKEYTWDEAAKLSWQAILKTKDSGKMVQGTENKL